MGLHKFDGASIIGMTMNFLKLGQVGNLILSLIQVRLFQVHGLLTVFLTQTPFMEVNLFIFCFQ